MQWSFMVMYPECGIAGFPNISKDGHTDIKVVQLCNPSEKVKIDIRIICNSEMMTPVLFHVFSCLKVKGLLGPHSNRKF